MAQYFTIAPKADQLRGLERVVGAVAREIDKLLAGAVRDTARQLRTRISTKIRERAVFKKKDIDQYITLYEYKGAPQARVGISESARVPLKYFAARQNRQGVSYKIMKTDARQTVPSAFIVGKLGDHVFKRFGLKRPATAKSRYAGQMRQKIARLQGPSPWGVFVGAGLEPETASEAEELLQNNLDRRTNLMLLRLAGKVETPSYEKN